MFNRNYFAAGADGCTILGIMGEAPKLTGEEALGFVSRCLRRAPGKPFIVGVSAPGFAAMGVACGGTGRWLEMSYPGLLAAPLQLGAVHVKVCVDLEVDAEQATPDAVLWVQNM